MFNERFPGGFTPRFGADITDMSTVVGLRGETLSGLSWDLSVGAAESDVEFFMRNTINASLGPETPIEFKPRTYTQTDVNVNFDLSYPLDIAVFHSPLNIAVGADGVRNTSRSAPVMRRPILSAPMPTAVSATHQCGLERFPGIGSQERRGLEAP